MRFQALIGVGLVVVTSLVATSLTRATPENSPTAPMPASSTNSATAEMVELNKAAQSHYDRQDYPGARRLWQLCLEKSERRFGSEDTRIAPALNRLGFCYESEGKNDKALVVFQRALMIREKALGTDDPMVGFSLRNLASAYQLQGNYEEAAALSSRSLTILEKALGPEHPDLAVGLICLANAYQAQGDYSNALALSERAQAIKKKAVGEDHPDFAAGLDNLASIYQSKGDYQRAADFYQRSLSIREKSLGTSHPDVAQALSNIAAVYRDQGNYGKALGLFERSLAIFEHNFGLEHRQVAYVLGCLAGIQLSLGHYNQALAFSKRSLSIQEKLFGPDSHEVAGSLVGAATIHKDSGDYSQALASLRRAQDISETHFGIEDPMATVIENSLASAYFDLGSGPRAIALLERTHEIRAKFLKPEHPQFVHSAENLASFYCRAGEWERAAQLFRTSLEIKERVYGKEHIEVAYSVWGLAHCYQALGRSEAATGLFKRCVTIKEQASGPESAAVGNGLGDLAGCYESQARYGEALPLRERSLAILEHSYGAEHPHVALALVGLASVCKALGNHERALPLAQRGLNVAEKSYGPENPKLVMFLGNLAAAYLAERNFDAALQLCRRALRIDLNAFGNAHPSVVTDFNQLALASLEQGDLQLGREYLSSTLDTLRRYFVGLFLEQPSDNALAGLTSAFFLEEMYHSLCGGGGKDPGAIVKSAGAERLSLDKALLEETQAAQLAAELDSRTRTQELWERYQAVRAHLARLSELKLDTAERETKRQQLQAEMSEAESRAAEKIAFLAQSIRERNLRLSHIAKALPAQSVLVDFVEFHRYDCTTKTNEPKEVRYAAYLTFPLVGNSTNLVVERVDLGESAPINEAVEFICRRMSSGMGYARADVSAASQQLGELVYAPLAKYLTNVAHLIICPDGQLSRVPFEMLRVGDRFLIEEKTVSYVTSGREVDRLAGTPKYEVRSSKSLVMGGPDFDLNLPKAGSNQRDGARDSGPSTLNSQVSTNRQSLLTSAATRALSRDYQGTRFTPLPEAKDEARNVAHLLGGECVLRVGPDARESELKAVQSPRVLHLATHGFFLSDQEFRRTNSPPFGRLGEWGQAGSLPYVQNEWENPLVRCGIALAGANHADQITNALTEDGLLTGLEAALLNLQGTELVILSACDSGTGEVKIGEGVMSLRRAFRIAGAQTVLASHWKVSDKATSQLMTEFIRRWRAGEPRAKAWREAQLSLLRSKEFSSPYFWAAFTLTGQWS